MEREGGLDTWLNVAVGGGVEVLDPSQRASLDNQFGGRKHFNTYSLQQWHSADLSVWSFLCFVSLSVAVLTTYRQRVPRVGALSRFVLCTLRGGAFIFDLLCVFIVYGTLAVFSVFLIFVSCVDSIIFFRHTPPSPCSAVCKIYSFTSFIIQANKLFLLKKKKSMPSCATV